MNEAARKLIKEWDEANGEGWSDCSESIAQIMRDFAKAQIVKLLKDLKDLRRHEMEFRWTSMYYINPDELDALVQSWEEKL
jgi:hypothetical protein